jgi:hypothetical protein
MASSPHKNIAGQARLFPKGVDVASIRSDENNSSEHSATGLRYAPKEGATQAPAFGIFDENNSYL